MRKSKTVLIVLAAAALMTASCGKMNLPNDGRLHFRVVADGTKGDVITTTSINTDGETFKLDAFLEIDDYQFVASRDNPHYIKGATVTFSGTEWKGNNLFWCDGIWTNFWATYPVTAQGRGNLTWTGDDAGTTTDAQEKTPSFTYDMSSYAGSTTAAEDTKDLLVSYCRSKWNEDEKTGGNVEFEMQHALSAIYFIKGHFDEGCDIDKITISGIQYAGTCLLEGQTIDLKYMVSISWEFQTDVPEVKEFSQSVSTGLGEDGSLLGTKYFFLIPQPMQETATLTAHITGGVGDENKQVSLSGYSWKPGCKYKYDLSYYKDKDEIKVTTTEYTIAENGLWTD
ncbi:MAG: fimbrillin family protein [Bacteroidales bacterium]|nr:fimbrillin family protein [Bacteroidales bacterium]